MLESVVRRLSLLANGATLWVKDCPLDLPIWALPNVQRFKLEIPDPTYHIPRIAKLGPLKRHHAEIGTWWNRLSHARLDRTLSAARVHVSAGANGKRLGKWSRGFAGLHVVGGGALNDVFPAELWQRCCLIHAFADQGKPVVLTGQQIGPFRSSTTKGSLARALRKATFVGLREPTGSVDFCKWARLESGAFEVMGDDSLGLLAANNEKALSILTDLGVVDKRFIAVNIRIGYYANTYQRYLDTLADTISQLSDRFGCSVLVIPIAVGIVDSDVAAGHQLMSRMRGTAVQVLDRPDLDASIIKRIVGTAWAAIGVSYHFGLFALEQGVPTILLSDDPYYDQKARGLAAFWGDRRIAMPIAELRDPVSFKHIVEVFEDPGLRDGLSKRAQTAREVWQARFDKVVLETLYK